MKKLNNKAFTVVELLTSFTLASVVMILLANILVAIKEDYVRNKTEVEVETQSALLADVLNEDAYSCTANSHTSTTKTTTTSSSGTTSTTSTSSKSSGKSKGTAASTTTTATDGITTTTQTHTISFASSSTCEVSSVEILFQNHVNNSTKEESLTVTYNRTLTNGSEETETYSFPSGTSYSSITFTDKTLGQKEYMVAEVVLKTRFPLSGDEQIQSLMALYATN